jgi:predicted RNase H-like HicB family nuclease
MKYRVIVEQDDDGAYVARVPELPGCTARATTREEAIEKIKREIALYFKRLNTHIEPVASAGRDDHGKRNA